VLGFLPGSQGSAGQPDQRKVTVSSMRLDRADVQLAFGSVDLLADMDDLVVEVDVLPAQAQSFPSAHPVQQQQGECGVERIRSVVVGLVVVRRARAAEASASSAAGAKVWPVPS